MEPTSIEDIKKELNKAIMHIARGSGLYKEEVEKILVDMYKDRLT